MSDRAVRALIAGIVGAVVIAVLVLGFISHDRTTACVDYANAPGRCTTR